ncbi:MAG: LysE family translocator [Pseudomonadota bacterium]
MAMPDLWIFLPACFALNVAFGPNNLLALTHGIVRGPGFALVASLGRLVGFSLLIALSSVGLGIVLAASVQLFLAIKILGAAYLIYLGWRLLFRAKGPGGIGHHVPTLREATVREFLVSIGNPKAVLIFVAFLPQFVDADRFVTSTLIVGALFLLMEVVAIIIYAVGGRMARRFAQTRLHWLTRTSGVGMIIFGTLLLLAKPPASQNP